MLSLVLGSETGVCLHISFHHNHLGDGMRQSGSSWSGTQPGCNRAIPAIRAVPSTQTKLLLINETDARSVHNSEALVAAD